MQISKNNLAIACHMQPHHTNQDLAHLEQMLQRLPQLLEKRLTLSVQPAQLMDAQDCLCEQAHQGAATDREQHLIWMPHEKPLGLFTIFRKGQENNAGLSSTA